MTHSYDVAVLVRNIETLKQTALDLRRAGEGIITVERNVDRILADVRLLELGISDVVDIL